jgi:hypothetical protein
MKLKRENLVKTSEGGTLIYKYTYEETDFFLTMSGARGTRKIEVFKGNMEDKQELLETGDSLKAWNYFEDLIGAMAEAEGSSGGFKNNPQENPNIMPFLAIKFDTNIGGYDCTFFVKLDDGTQQRVFDFHISFDAMPMQFQSPNVETVDWKEQEVPALFKCEVLLKYMSALEFEEDKEKSVFLFIPKSIMEQGGEKGGGEPTNEGGEPTEKGEPKGKGKPTNEPPQAPKGKEKPSDEKPNEGGTTSDEDTEQSDDKGEDKAEKAGNGDSSPFTLNFSETLKKIAEISGRRPSQLLATFRTKNVTETWLNTNNFENIKRGLNLPASTTASELAEKIINSK